MDLWPFCALQRDRSNAHYGFEAEIREFTSGLQLGISSSTCRFRDLVTHSLAVVMCLLSVTADELVLSLAIRTAHRISTANARKLWRSRELRAVLAPMT